MRSACLITKLTGAKIERPSHYLNNRRVAFQVYFLSSNLKLSFRSITTMSSSFVHAPRTETGGSAVDAWLRTNWDEAIFTGADLIATNDGSRHPVKECAVVFRNFRSVMGTPGAYFADPIAVVQYRSAMLTAIEGRDKYDHPVVRQNDVLIPLGTPNWNSPTARIVLQQSARQWVSGGLNMADMSDEHIITMYYAALQQLVFAGGNAVRAADQQQWFPALVSLTQAFSAIHASYEAVRKVTAALVLTPGANDMIQKGLAYVFHSAEEWSKEARLDMLAIAIRRNFRHGTAVVGMAPGPFVLFVLVPLLRAVAHPDGAELFDRLPLLRSAMSSGAVLAESAALLERFNAAASELLHAFVEDASGSSAAGGAAGGAGASTFRERVLVSLTAAMGTPLTTAQTRSLLEHIAGTDASAEPDWAALGVLPAKPVFAATVLADRFSVDDGRRSTFRVKVVPTATDWLNAYSYKGVEWAALGFKTPGTYIVYTHDLGIASRSAGDTRGKELTANWRITAGTAILPAQRPGYSLTGAEHQRTPRGRWDYFPNEPLSADTPFLVVVEPTRVRLQQASRIFFTMEKGRDEPALLAFKNMWLRIHYKAPAPVPAPPTAVPTVPRTPTPVSSGRSWASMAAAGAPGAPARGSAGAPTHAERVLDLPPTALIARLRELAADE